MTEVYHLHLVLRLWQNFCINMILISYVGLTRFVNILTITSILLIYFFVLFLGCRRWLWVLCEASIGHFIFCTKLLWRVWQCWSNDVCWRNSNVLIPDFKGMIVKLFSISRSLLQVIFFLLLNYFYKLNIINFNKGHSCVGVSLA